jgi:hypothetical protein
MEFKIPLGTKKRGFGRIQGTRILFLGHISPAKQPIAKQISYPQNTRS